MYYLIIENVIYRKYLIRTITRMPFLVWQLLKLLISQIYELETNTKDERSFHFMRKWYFELTFYTSKKFKLFCSPSTSFLAQSL